MKANLIKLGTVGLLTLALTACVVAPVQPVGYRVTSTTVPGYYDNTTVVQTTTPVYNSYYYPYYPSYYAPTYVDPLYGVGVGLGIGIGVNYFRGGYRSGWGGGYRNGYRGSFRRR